MNIHLPICPVLSTYHGVYAIPAQENKLKTWKSKKHLAMILLTTGKTIIALPSAIDDYD